MEIGEILIEDIKINDIVFAVCENKENSLFYYGSFICTDELKSIFSSNYDFFQQKSKDFLNEDDAMAYCRKMNKEKYGVDEVFISLGFDYD